MPRATKETTKRRTPGLALCASLAAAALLALVVGASALAEPIGSQVRISQMGPDGNTDFAGRDPAVAYNSQANQYLVVWDGDDVTNGELEIFGRLVDAAGSPVGGEFRISQMGPDGNFNFAGFKPAVAYNSQANQYLVVWSGTDDTAPLVQDEFEIFGQRLDAGGSEVGTDDFRISDMGPNGDADFAAREPAVAYNSQANQYLTVWEGEDDTAPLVDNEDEIFGQRLDASGAETGSNDFRISDMGPDGNTSFNAQEPAVAYDSQANQHLVVWYGDDATNNEEEIFGQRLDASGAETGSNDFRISDMGPDGDTLLDAKEPAVAYNSLASEHLVVWRGDDATNNEDEIFGQRLSAAGAEIGTNDFRMTQTGPDGDANFDARGPAVAYGSQASEYLLVWRADGPTDDEVEVFGQRLSAAGAEIGTNDFRMSQMGPDGDPNFDGYAPAAAYNSQANQYLAVWEGDDDTAPLVDGELEVFARRSSAGAPPSGAPDTTAPVVSKLTITKRFAPSSKATPVASKKKKTRRGGRVAYTLSEAATVELVVSRRTRGVRIKRKAKSSAKKKTRCVSRTKKNKRKLRREIKRKLRKLKGKKLRRRTRRETRKAKCTLYKKKGTLRRAGKVGKNRHSFSGRIGKRKLKRGRYRIVVTATDEAGNASKPKRKSFKIVKAKKKKKKR